MKGEIELYYFILMVIWVRPLVSVLPKYLFFLNMRFFNAVTVNTEGKLNLKV